SAVSEGVHRCTGGRRRSSTARATSASDSPLRSGGGSYGTIAKCQIAQSASPLSGGCRKGQSSQTVTMIICIGPPLTLATFRCSTRVREHGLPSFPRTVFFADGGELAATSGLLFVPGNLQIP